MGVVAECQLYAMHYPQNVFINREMGVEPELAENCTINGLIDCIRKVIIEKDAFFGHDIIILTGGHDYTKFGDERRQSNAGGLVTIREGAWIASRAMLIGPCEIGKHAVVAAGSVVVKDVPPYQVWGGNPARHIKEIPR